MTQKTRFVRRRMRRGILVRGGILIGCVLGLGALLLIQTERRYSLQRDINTLKSDIKQLQADNETYQNELDFLDIPNIKKIAQRTGLRATNPDQVIILDFSAWATINDIPVVPVENDLWTATIAPIESSSTSGRDSATLSSAPEQADTQEIDGDVAMITPEISQEIIKQTSSPTITTKSIATVQPTQQVDDFDSIIPEASSYEDMNDENMIEIMEEVE